ncbi:WD40/YVTN/BNR-like repeat-containing protein [Oleomonas cavernae]|uniref:WD40/YVTN/BNR-like repeat-containing protein n=1 Tax=Oleomonas cavernae TaxID=2320859 RepID=UPI00131450E9|nr:YCF48-related protein [Oleomonas cavernae]
MTLVLGLSMLVQSAALPAGAKDAGNYRIYPDNLFGVALGGQASVVSGYHGALFVSADGGRAWVQQDSGTDDLLRRVKRLPGGRFVAVSHRGAIMMSDTAGHGWRVVHTEAGQYLRDVAFADDQVGWAVGHNGLILRTTDGGNTWTPFGISDYKGRDLPRLSGVVALDKSHALAVGEFGVVASTSDGGATWKIVTEQVYPTLLDVAVAGSGGYAVGLNGTLLALSMSRAGEWTMKPLPSKTMQHLLSVALSADGSKGLIGGNGLLLTLGKSGFEPAMVVPTVPLSYLWVGGSRSARTVSRWRSARAA